MRSAHSARIPVRSMILFSFTVSLLMKSANSSGVPGEASAPCVSNAVCIVAVFRISTRSRFTFEMIWVDVPAGASIPTQ